MSIQSLVNSVAFAKNEGKCVSSKEMFDSLDAVFGEAKVKAVCQRYGISTPKTSDKTLKLSKLRKILTGLTDVGMQDVEDFYRKIKEKQPLTERENRALSQLKNYKNEIKNSKDLQDLNPEIFNALVNSLKHPSNEFDNFVFRKMQLHKVTAIPEKYFKHGWLSHKLGRAKEDEERICLMQELESLKTGDEMRYAEVLSKLVVKKHLFYETNICERPKMGMLVPGLKDASGNPTWYKVDDILDSGVGKFAYKLTPAVKSYADTMPDIILYRSSSTLPTAMDSFTSYINDINILPPGYLSQKKCRKQELSWAEHPTETLTDKTRPLFVIGHSLGASNSQLLLVNLQKSGKLPERKIKSILFDSPAIKAADAKSFASWVKTNNLQDQFEFDYHISEHDPVPLAGHLLGSSYLGAGIVRDEKHVASVHKMKLTKQGAKNLEVKGLGAHGRLYYRGAKDQEYTVKTCTVEKFNRDKKEARLALNIFKSFGALLVWPTLGLVGLIKRVFIGRRHHKPAIAKLFNRIR